MPKFGEVLLVLLLAVLARLLSTMFSSPLFQLSKVKHVLNFPVVVIAALVYFFLHSVIALKGYKIPDIGSIESDLKDAGSGAGDEADVERVDLQEFDTENDLISEDESPTPACGKSACLRL